MEKIEFLLIQLEGLIYTTYPTLLNFFNDSISISHKFNDNSLLKFYEWRNGTKINLINNIGVFQFCSFGYFLSYEDCLIFQKQFIEERYFNKENYFPIVASLGGDFLLVDITKPKSKVYLYSPSLLINDPMEVYSSLDSFIKTVYECFAKEIYKYDNEYYLQIDYELEKEITIKFNSEIEYWIE
jgi:hypothetical protein